MKTILSSLLIMLVLLSLSQGVLSNSRPTHFIVVNQDVLEGVVDVNGLRNVIPGLSRQDYYCTKPYCILGVRDGTHRIRLVSSGDFAFLTPSSCMSSNQGTRLVCKNLGLFPIEVLLY